MNKEDILYAMKKNSQEGVHTYCICTCGREGYRASYADRCNTCYKELLRKKTK